MQNEGKETMLEKMLKRDSGRQLSARINAELMEHLLSVHLFLCRTVEPRFGSHSLDFIRNCIHVSKELRMLYAWGSFNPDSLMLPQFVFVWKNSGFRKHGAILLSSFELPIKPYRGFPNDNETQTLFDFIYFTVITSLAKRTLMLKLMRDVIRNRLISVLRERESLVYLLISLFYEGIP